MQCRQIWSTCRVLVNLLILGVAFQKLLLKCKQSPLSARTGNYFESEALAGSLPTAQNNPRVKRMMLTQEVLSSHAVISFFIFGFALD